LSTIIRDGTVVSNFHFPLSIFELRFSLLPFAFCDLPFALLFLETAKGIVND